MPKPARFIQWFRYIVTDGQTDGRREGQKTQSDSVYHDSIASRGKNEGATHRYITSFRTVASLGTGSICTVFVTDWF